MAGFLVSGGSMAKLIGIAAGRDAKGGKDIARLGLKAQRKRLVLYMAEEGHNSLDKAVSILGIGSLTREPRKLLRESVKNLPPCSP